MIWSDAENVEKSFKIYKTRNSSVYSSQNDVITGMTEIKREAGLVTRQTGLFNRRSLSYKNIPESRWQICFRTT